MSNPLIRSEDHFVLLEPDSKEKIVTKKEAILWLRNWLPKIDSSTIYQKKDYSNEEFLEELLESCLLYTSPSPRDATLSRMPSSA